jgi:short-subunit dehydrogenase
LPPKFATTGLAEALSIELEDDGVHVLNVCPGAIRTPFFDEEDLARMPPVAKDGMAEPEDLVAAIMKALRQGKHEVTFPYGIRAGYIVKAIAPGFMRKQVRRVTLDAINKQRT